MWKEASVSTGCKINTYLRILGRRNDGFHEIRTLIHPVTRPSDTLHISPLSEGRGLALSCSDQALSGEENILYRVYEAFARATGAHPDLEVYLEKEVPHGSGLGGASADAAAFLHYLQSGLPREARLSSPRLMRLAASVGSDIPFFLVGRTAWISGKGEIVQPSQASGLSREKILIVCPSLQISTAWAYKAYDRENEERGGDLSALVLTKSAKGDSFRKDEQGPKYWCNDFESVVFRSCPELRLLKSEIFQCGARAAVMSGSGSSLAVLPGEEEAWRHCMHLLNSKALPYFVSESS